jgi:uncharacterized protein YqeY
MSLQQQINTDILSAMKICKSELSVLRATKTAITNNALVNKGNAQAELSDTEVIAVIRKQIAQREDSYSQFAMAGREDLAKNELEEIYVLRRYLPVELSPEQIDLFVKQAITDTGAMTKKDMGKAIKRASELVNGGTDNKTLSQKISKLLP